MRFSLSVARLSPLNPNCTYGTGDRHAPAPLGSKTSIADRLQKTPESSTGHVHNGTKAGVRESEIA